MNRPMYSSLTRLLSVSWELTTDNCELTADNCVLRVASSSFCAASSSFCVASRLLADASSSFEIFRLLRAECNWVFRRRTKKKATKSSRASTLMAASAPQS